VHAAQGQRLGQGLETVAYLARNYKFESTLLQRTGSCGRWAWNRGRRILKASRWNKATGPSWIRCARVRSFIATHVDSNWLPAANGKSRDANQLLQSATRHCRCHPNRLRPSRDWAVLTRRCSSNIAARQRTPFPGEAADPALAREASHAGRTFLWKIKALETEWDSFCFAVSHTFSK